MDLLEPPASIIMDTSTMKIEAAGSSKALINFYYIACHHSAENSISSYHPSENLQYSELECISHFPMHATCPDPLIDLYLMIL
jgi:hypothetical protein